jgi:hypothetical protein
MAYTGRQAAGRKAKTVTSLFTLLSVLGVCSDLFVKDLLFY